MAKVYTLDNITYNLQDQMEDLIEGLCYQFGDDNTVGLHHIENNMGWDGVERSFTVKLHDGGEFTITVSHVRPPTSDMGDEDEADW